MKLERMLVASLAVAILAACHSGEPVPQASSPAPAATVASAASARAPASGPLSMASFAGYGDMRFGMDDASFRKAWSGELKGEPPAPGATCTYLYPTWVKTPSEIAFMFEGGKFVRYDVRTAKDVAPGGGKVGMDKAKLLALYNGKLLEQPDKYVSGASTLRVEGDDYGVLLFEVGADGKVNKWRVGIPPQIDYVEGCG